jgi:hypothetical protein
MRIVLRFESKIAGNARLKAASNPASSVLPRRNSSFSRSKMRMFASIAMPMDRIMPAIAGSEKVTPSDLNIAVANSTYSPSAITEMTPGSR